MSSILQWGAQIVRQAQSLGPGWLLPAQVITLLGSEQFFVFLVTLVYWCLDTSLGIRLAFLLVSVDSLTGCLKLAFHQPRPYWFDATVRALSTESSYGLPSGHASATSSVGLFLAERVRRWWAWVLGAVLVLAISCSRVYLGVHFPTDIVAGWGVGALGWLAFAWLLPRFREWVSQANLPAQLALALAASLAVLVCSAAILWAIASQADPPQWAVLASRATGVPLASPRSPKDLVSEAGLVLGLGMGAVLSRRFARHHAGGRLGKRVLRYLVGMGVILLWEGALPLLLAGIAAWNDLSFLYLRSALTGFWAVFLAPVVFLRLGLAEQAP